MLGGRADSSCGQKDFQRQVLELARLYRWHACHPALSKWSERGWPDLALVRPPRLVFAELKSESGKVTEHQERWLALPGACPGVEVFLWRPSDLETIAGVLRWSAPVCAWYPAPTRPTVATPRHHLP